MPRLSLRSDTGWTWVLTLTWAGQDWRWVSRDVRINDATGAPLRLLPGLEAEAIRHQLRSQGIAESQELSFDVHFPSGYDVASQVQAGHVMVGATAEVALLPDSGTWADRRVVIAGHVEDPVYGAVDESVGLTVARPAIGDDALVPDPAAVITSETWPTSPEDSRGLMIPVVYGMPGVFVDESGTTRYTRATPAPIIEYEYDAETETNLATLLGACAYQVTATTVRVWARNDTLEGGWDSWNQGVEMQADGTGIPRAVVDISSRGPVRRSAGTYFLDWRHGQGAVLDDGLGRSALGSIAAWWMRRSGYAMDVARSAGGFASLLGLGAGGYVEEPVHPLDWLNDRVLELAPVAQAWTASGVAIRPVPWRATAGQAVMLIEIGGGTAVRVSGVRGPRRPGPNEVRVQWALDIADNRYRMTTVVSQLRSGSISTFTAASGNDGSTTGRVLRAPDCWDQGTAYLLGLFEIWKASTRRRWVDVDLASDRYADLIEGDVVLLDDEDLHWSRTVAFVESISSSDGPWRTATIALL